LVRRRMLGISSIEICQALHHPMELNQIVKRFIMLAVLRRGPLTMNQNKLISSIDVPPSDQWSTILSRREIRIALLVARGFSNKKVARELGLAEGTVKGHLFRVFQKLGAKRRYDLIVQVSGEAKQRQRANKSIA